MSEQDRISWPGWETVQLIGRGSFGSVYEIQRDVCGDLEKAALKVISIPQNPSDIEELYNDGYDDESITATFDAHLKSIISEYSLMQQLGGSANVVNCKDIRYIQHDNGIGWDIFIRMELLTPLVRALPANISEETVIRIGKDICNALVLCKKHDIVHRDIKPQNIFVSPNGDYKLGDFGIAKTVEKTMGGTKIGTYKYMAPEVYNNQPYGSAADIYSLGLVLYWLLNERRMPFVPLPPAKIRAGQDEEARHRRLSGDKLPDPAYGSDGLKRIVLKACAYDPKDRYESAAAMLDDLNKLSGSAVVILDDTLVEEQEDDKTVGPVFDGVKKEPSEDLDAVDLDGTDGSGFTPKPAPHEEPFEEENPLETPDHLGANSNLSIPKYVLIAVGIIAVIILFLFLRSCDTETYDSTEDTQTVRHNGWSDWEDELPKKVSDEEYKIDERTLYRSRTLETTTSTENSTMSGWELYDTVEANGEFGPWSDWSDTQVEPSDTREVETQTRYRYADRETTTDTSPQKEGWTQYDMTTSWGDYGAWSGWSTKSVAESESREVETKTQYRYRTMNYTTSNDSALSGWTYYSSSTSYGSWSSWSDTSISNSSSVEVETRQVQTGTKYLMAHYCTGNISDAKYLTSKSKNTTNKKFNENCTYHELGWFSSLDKFYKYDEDGGYLYGSSSTGNCHRCSNTCYRWYIVDREDIYKTQYRYRDVSTIYYYYQWGGWSDYDDSYIAGDDEREVSTRTLYKYRERESILTYHFYRWGDWSEWSEDKVVQNDNRQVESATFYRYRDQAEIKTYYFKRWSDWSDYSDDPIAESETEEVQTKTQYRYKKK